VGGANGAEGRAAGGMIAADRGVPLPASKAPLPAASIPERRPPQERPVVAPVPEEGSRAQFTAPPPARASRPGPVLVVLFLVAVGVGGGLYFRWRGQHPTETVALRVRVMAPKPTAVYRWFSTTGTVVSTSARTVAFETTGRVAEVLPSGASFEAGETLAKLQSAAVLETELIRNQARIASFEQQRDSLKAAGKADELHEAEHKLDEKKKLTEETQAALDKVLLKAPEAGQVLETMVKVGAPVTPKSPVLKWQGRVPHGDFTLDEEDFATAGKLDFCRVEVSGPPPSTGSTGDGPRFVDCKLPPPVRPTETNRTSPLRKFTVGLPSDGGLVTGQPLRLARLRYDGVFPLPPSAIVHDPTGEKVWVATSAGKAQLRAVTIAESREEALVTKGLSVGDEVILDPPVDLKDGTQVAPER